MRFLVLLGIFLLSINQSINQSIGKKFKPHGRYEKLAKQEYIQGINQLINQPINQPTAVLTSLTGIDRSIAVSWVTFNQSIHRSINRFTNQPIHQPIDQPINQSTNQSIFWGFQSNNYTHQSIATTKVWIDPSSTYNNQSIDQSIYRLMHQSTMQNLPPGTTVYYRVGSTNQPINQPIDQSINQLKIVNKLVNDQSTNQPINQPLGQLSQEWEFKTLPINQSINLAIYGDMGVVNARSMQSINQSIDQSITHMILHLGDYAYDLHTDNGTLGDVFMHNLQPLSARVPYMGCEGNHEGKYNASHYTNRFWAYNMLGRTSRSDTNWWFSWEYESNGAKVHFAMINTEMYYTYVDEFTPPDYSTQRAAQYQWLANDLAHASQTADWIFVYGHRPMYCSDVDSLGDCTSDATLLREGWPGENNGMDAILRKYGVDIYFTAHEHSYERTYPVSFGQIDLKQENHTYINPLYTTHIITGSAGCSEELEWFDPVNFAAWSMVRSPTYGYGHLIIHNKTHLHWEQLIDEGKQESDTLWIIKDKDYRQEVEMASELVVCD